MRLSGSDDSIYRALAGDRRASQHAGLLQHDAKRQSKLSGAHVLLAEDNPVNQEVAKEYLSELGCTFDVVTNGNDAIAACEQRHYDLVLMDCQMPDLDGLTATRRLREAEANSGRPPIVIIAATANAYAEDRAACLAAGMNDYLSKPFTEECLTRMLNKWAAGQRTVAA